MGLYRIIFTINFSNTFEKHGIHNPHDYTKLLDYLSKHVVYLSDISEDAHTVRYVR